MNQFQWTFLDNKRGRHTLGIAHSPTSGHLVVHCDHRVVLIDFSILEPRTFSFFVEDELCKLAIDGNVEDGFTYDFSIDTEVDTEVNRVRNVKERKRKRNTKLAMAAMLLFGVIFVYSIGTWGFNARKAELANELVRNGVRAEARLLAGGVFEFIAAADIVKGKPLKADIARMGPLKLLTGDTVEVLFDQTDSDNFIIDWHHALLPLRKDSISDTALSTAVESYFADVLPERAGSVKCAFRTAERLGGVFAQISLIDAYTRGLEDDLTRWRGRFKDAAYQNRLLQVCPPQAPVPSAN